MIHHKTICEVPEISFIEWGQTENWFLNFALKFLPYGIWFLGDYESRACCSKSSGRSSASLAVYQKPWFAFLVYFYWCGADRGDINARIRALNGFTFTVPGNFSKYRWDSPTCGCQLSCFSLNVSFLLVNEGFMGSCLPVTINGKKALSFYPHPR